MVASHSSSSVSSAINLINNVIGAGLLSMPWCLREATLVTGCIIFAVVCMLNVISFGLLARCSDMTGCFSYLDIGQQALGARFGVAAQVTTMLYACGSLVSYVVLVNNFLLGEGTGVLDLALPATFDHSDLGTRVCVGCAFSALFFLPLSCLRNLDSLKLTSWAALFATLYAGALTMWELLASPAGSLTPAEAAIGRTQLRASVHYVGVPLSMWEALPIVNVAFTAHYNGPRYYQELSARSVGRFVSMTSASLVGALAVYLTVGVSGYLAFGAHTAGDVMENFADAYPPAVAARGALLVVIVSCYPKVCSAVPARCERH